MAASSRSTADLCEAPEQAASELAPDDRGHLERALGVVGQTVDARGDDVLDGVGDVDAVDARLAKRADHLLHEERVALRLPRDQPDERPRQAG
jgi:hypothetical protein